MAVLATKEAIMPSHKLSELMVELDELMDDLKENINPLMLCDTNLGKLQGIPCSLQSEAA